MSDRRLTLQQAADRQQWSVKTLKRLLALHRIDTIGTGRRARLTEGDLQRLEVKERERCRTSSSRPESGGTGITGFAGRSPETALRSRRAARLAKQLRHGRPITLPGSKVSAFPVSER
jgi:hypothetical protein